MILQNYWAWMRYSQSTTSNLSITGITDTSGAAVTGYWSNVGSAVTGQRPYAVANHWLNNLNIVFGTGTTAPTSTDYNIETAAPSGVSVTKSVSFAFSDNNFQTIITATITNGSGAAVTLTELGLTNTFYAPHPSDQTNSTVTKTIMLVREVLETPLVLEAGTIKSITYTWTMQ